MAQTETKEATKTVADDMRARRCFYPNESATALAQAQEYLGASMESLSDFADFPFAAPGVGVDEEGNATFDSDVYPDSVGVMVGVLKKQGAGVKAIFMAPIPDFPAIIGSEDEAFTTWATGILEKEANHVAVRPLRDAEDVSIVVDQMPTTVEAYTTSGRGLGSGIMTAYNELYKAINATLANKSSAWAKRKLTKAELKRSLESSAYAASVYSELETREAGSIFVMALNMGVNGAKRKGLDPTIFERWIATRDQKAFSETEVDDEDDFDLDSLTDELLAEDEDDTAEA